MDASGLVLVVKISSRYFAIGAKNKILTGQSRIGVLEVRFSRIGA